MKWYIHQVAIAVDQLSNALLGGWADETLSSRSYRWHRDGSKLGFMRLLVDALFFFDKDHCYKSFISERRDMHSAPEFREL